MASEDSNSTLHPKALDQPGGSFGQSSTVDKLLEKVGVNVHKDLHGDRAAVAETAGLPVDAPEIQRGRAGVDGATGAPADPQHARTA